MWEEHQAVMLARPEAEAHSEAAVCRLGCSATEAFICILLWIKHHSTWFLLQLVLIDWVMTGIIPTNEAFLLYLNIKFTRLWMNTTCSNLCL